jgi:bifunctional non-homologous end joining protein LigD
MTKSRFIVVEHDAKKARLHWDLRFVMPSSKNWMSFAVRKGVPLEVGKKVLAVRTHDHSEEEALMLGTIESGYGAGELKKWDDGNCIIHKFSPSHILIEFKGKKVKGFYHLINTGVVKGQRYKSQQYMLFKGKSLNK